MFLLQFGILLLFGLILWILRTKRKYSNFPPGPPKLPWIGTLLSMLSSPYPTVVFENLSKRYGDIVHVKPGCFDAIAVNSHEAIKQILTDEKLSGRRFNITGSFRERAFNKDIGLIFCASSERWKTISRFTYQTLRDFGFGKSGNVETIMNQATEKVLSQIKRKLANSPDQSISGKNLFSQTFISLVWRMITGIEDTDDNDELKKQFISLNESFLKATNVAIDVSTAFPFLWDTFPRLFGKKHQMKIIQELHQFAKNLIQKHRMSGNYKHSADNYIDAFLAKMEESKSSPSSFFSEEELAVCLLDILQSGGETSSDTLSFSIIYMMLNPHIQENVWKEIKSEVRKDEIITASMKKRLPYTHATLLETLRWSVVIPFTPKLASEDFYLNGYFIQKGMTLFLNLHAAHFSESKWGDPHNFRPERFLTKDGNVDGAISASIVSFGGGRRVCVGQSVAESSMFTVFASLLRSYKLTNVEGQKEPTIQPVLGVTYTPKHFRVQFIPRE